MADLMTVHAFVSGRVQGVFYRDCTRKKAIELGVNGWVKNLDNGRVELTASGSEEQVAALMDWLWIGSPSSDVTEVKSEYVSHQEFSGFKVTR